MEISKDNFINIIRQVPLVSIDLIVKDSNGKCLLGLRSNAPARDNWFVPGGRIKKGERLADAFKRITKNELCTELDINNARFLGVFEHLYDTNFAGEPDVGTHYVVLAYEMLLTVAPQQLPKDQHCQWQYFPIDSLFKHPQVHKYTKNYFINQNRT